VAVAPKGILRISSDTSRRNPVAPTNRIAGTHSGGRPAKYPSSHRHASPNTGTHRSSPSTTLVPSNHTPVKASPSDPNHKSSNSSGVRYLHTHPTPLISFFTHPFSILPTMPIETAPHAVSRRLAHAQDRRQAKSPASVQNPFRTLPPALGQQPIQRLPELLPPHGTAVKEPRATMPQQLPYRPVSRPPSPSGRPGFRASFPPGVNVHTRVGEPLLLGQRPIHCLAASLPRGIPPH